MRIVFCGSGTFATTTLAAILDSGHDVATVVTQPPRPAGRGGKLHATAVELAAQAAGVEAFPCADINAESPLAYIRYKKPDVICVVEYGQFLRSAVRQASRLGAFNLHASVLPALRGAAPVNWAIIHGMKHTGVSTFSLVDKPDAGPVYLTAKLDIGPDERAGELRSRLGRLGAKVVLDTLELLDSGKAEPRPQDDSCATFAPLLKKSDGFLNFAIPAEHLVWKIRGTWPWPGARAVFGHRHGRAVPVTIVRATLAEGSASGKCGLIDEDVCVSTAKGRLRILEIKPDGKRLMNWEDFVNGYRVSAGDIFNLPCNT